MMRVFTACCCALALVGPSTSALAQDTRAARLLLTVVDQTGAIIPNAVVTAIRVDDPAKTVLGPVKTNDKGLATLEKLSAGVYTVEAEFPGFEKRTLKDLKLRAGDNKQVAILTIEGLRDAITVERDKQAAAADPKSTFGTALTREQIEALSDDPEEMRRQIMDMAPDAVLRIDSFEGGQLPPKAQIKSIHITRDQFAAESHYAGAHFIDIITQPGVGPLRFNTRLGIRDSALNARNPLTAVKGPERSQNYGINVGGSLIKNKSSFSLSVNGSDSFRTPNLYAATPGGATRSENINLKQRNDNIFTYGNFDYAVTRDQTLRVSFNTQKFTDSNQGVGLYDEESRAYTSRNTRTNVRIQEAGPLGRRFFTNTRLQLNYQTSKSESAVELPTIRINDALTRGGAQQAGGRRSRSANLISDLDYVRGIHSFRTGIDVNATWYRSDEATNYLGTYTFESMDAFLASVPRSYTRRIGNPNLSYTNVLGGIYIQDDIRIRKNLTLSGGLRYELQTHLDDYNNFAPRFGINWAPFKSGRTTIRASAGIFYDWFSTGTYEQTLRVDGFRQQELNILDPTYPDPGSEGIVSATNRYLMADDLGMIRSVRFSAGVQQTLTPRIRFGATYANSHGYGNLRGVNLNAPVNGVRPDPRFSNVFEIDDDAESKTHMLSTNFSVSFMTPSPAAQRARFNWRRGSFNVNYTLAQQRNNTDGAFSVPFSGSPAGEWGPANFDIRHRLNLGINTQALRNLNLFINGNVSSAPPFTIRTGRDDNGDLVFNDRPAGVGRNTERGLRQINLNANASYTISFGKRKVQAPPGIMVTGGPAGVVSVTTTTGQEVSRYRMSFNIGAQNILNRVNRTGFNGTMTSPFFLQPTGVGSPRRVDMGISFSF
jgi:hypothetical protein